MKKLESVLSTVKSVALGVIIFLLPLIFLTTTQEFYVTTKLYFLSISMLLLLLVSAAELLVSKKIVWKKMAADNIVILILVATGLSILIASPNKIQAILNPNFGLMMVFSLVIFYFYISRQHKLKIVYTALYLSSVVLSLITLVVFLQPLKNTALPTYLQFLKNPSFSPIGNQVDLLLLLGFVAVLALQQILPKLKNISQVSPLKLSPLTVLAGIASLLAAGITLFNFIKPILLPTVTAQATLTLPPLRLSWYAAVEILKNPLSALFGVGIDNYSSIFSRVKDLFYNQTGLWQISSFVIARTALLHVFTESGLFGLVSFVIALLYLSKSTLSKHSGQSLYVFSFVFILVAFLIAPPSLIVFMLLFYLIAIISHDRPPFDSAQGKPSTDSSLDLSNLLPVYLGSLIITLLIIGASGFLLTQAYLAEVYAKKATDAVAQNNLQGLYNNQRIAIGYNPYIERFRINFSQTNLLLINNVVQQAVTAAQQKGGETRPQLTADQQQILTQAVQTAINEGKAVITLNTQKSENWANLATIYQSIINLVQGQADVWTIASYQRAIVLDPQNPSYRLNLGGVYYAQGVYDEAVKLFEQAASLKPDWANAYYNLAWADFRRKEYQRAVQEMQTVLSLIDPKKDATDYNLSSKDLEQFKTYLPKPEAQTQTEQTTQPQLTLPTPAPETAGPKISLPKEASPEAK